MNKSDMIKVLLCYSFERNYNKYHTIKKFDVQKCDNFDFIDIVCDSMNYIDLSELVKLNEEEYEYYYIKITNDDL